MIDLKKYNGFVTVHNPETGNHRTFRISTCKSGNLEGKRVVGLLTGPDNTSDYTGFGFVNDDGSITVWKKHRGSIYDRHADILSRSEYYETVKRLEYQFSVKCRVCNRDLTDPESIELGIGPICRGEK